MNNSEAENVDTLIYNVRVATMAAENPSDYAAVSAIAVSKGKIVWMGKAEEDDCPTA